MVTLKICLWRPGIIYGIFMGLNTQNPVAMPSENKWLARLRQAIRENIAGGGLDNTALAAHMGVSERHLIRRVKQLTSLSPKQYVRQQRLQRARQLLKEGACRTVKAAAGAVGYTSVSYFISQFEQEFGRRPLEVLREVGWR